jgi:hypothetical protein
MQALEKSGKQEGDIRKLYKVVWKYHMSAVQAVVGYRRIELRCREEGIGSEAGLIISLLDTQSIVE